MVTKGYLSQSEEELWAITDIVSLSNYEKLNNKSYKVLKLCKKYLNVENIFARDTDYVIHISKEIVKLNGWQHIYGQQKEWLWSKNMAIKYLINQTINASDHHIDISDTTVV